MDQRSLSIVAFGTCYVDINSGNYPFDSSGIQAETELIGADYDVVAGGSAVNFCRLLTKLSLPCTFIGMAGLDRMGSLLETILQESGIKPVLIRKPGLTTNISFNMTSPEGAHIMCVAGTANSALSPDAVLPAIRETLSQRHIIYLGGCFKLTAFADAFPEFVKLTREQSATLVIDHGRIPATASPEMLSAVRELVLGADYYLPSRKEFCQLWGIDTIAEGLQLLNTRSPGLTVVVKDGANGAYHWNGAPCHTPAQRVSGVVTMTGAGDSFNAGLMRALTHGRDLAGSISHGVTVAAAHISGQPLPALS